MKGDCKQYLLGCIACFITGMPAAVWAQKAKPVKPLPPVSAGAGNRLVYTTDAKGNRVPDFSYCGYKAGEQAIPDVPVRVVVPLQQGDATARIQAALDYVAGRPADANGIRGAVLLQKGAYTIAGQLRLQASGVVLRGSGMDSSGTILLGTGTDRQTLIAVGGRNNRRLLHEEQKITDAYVPVNATTLHVTGNSWKAGDKVIIHRPSTQAWIQQLGTDHFGGGITALGWKPGDRDLYWDRTIQSVEGSTITLDAPLTTALDTAAGGGTIAAYEWPGRISVTGVENLRCASTYDKSNAKDEAHRWMAITFDNVCDAWVRQVVFEHFAGSAVAVWETAKRITVEDCLSLQPVSEIGGQRRNTFWTTGQQVLFQRLYAEYGYHDFAAGFCAAGPIAFVQCESHLPYSFSGAIDSWASGVLFDVVNIDGQALSYLNRGQDAQGAGWSAANSVFWQCTAARIDCYQPPGAQNWAFGSWAQFAGDGYWGESNNHIQPRSLYYAQLEDRLGKPAAARAQLIQVETEASSSPTVAQAAALTAASVQPHITLKEWIQQAAQRQRIPVETAGAKNIDQLGLPVAPPGKKKAPLMHLQNGWLVRGNAVLTGKHHEVPWWMGFVRPAWLKNAKPAITRFVPGRTGTGLTDDLEEVTGWMQQHHIVSLEHNYGLWYERRRDDHERIRRMDGDVWPPFYELPFARSGKETAWDGLSKYDLTRYNSWYWMRLKQFADLADEKGLVLVHQNYFQHNIIEAGAHYADFPWRPANNINNTGFPEPPPYAGDKRIFMAQQFYDTTHPVRKALHKAYIRQCLDNFSGNNGVIQLIGAEFTGPLHFVQFWTDQVRGWEKEKNKKELIGLSTTKDVQDAMLADAARAAVIDVIDIRYWYYQADGSVYAPPGGQSLAPRQQARLFKPKRSSFEQVYRAVREYRQKFPGKAVMYGADGYDSFGWAVFMAGGSLAAIPPVADSALLSAAAGMLPTDLPGLTTGQWALQKGNDCIIYSTTGHINLHLEQAPGRFNISWLNPATGRYEGKTATIRGGKNITLEHPLPGAVVLWVRKV